MSQVTTYKCDKCKEESINSEDLKLTTIGVGVKSTAYGSSYREKEFHLYDPLRREMEICPDCLSNLGFVRREKIDPEKVEVQYPTLEDMIREIIREEIDGKDGIRL